MIVSDEGRFWYVSRSGNAREASNLRGRTGGASQVERLIARLPDGRERRTLAVEEVGRLHRAPRR